MEKSRIALILGLSVTFSMPAVAGPNWDVIHRAEAAKAAHKHEHEFVLPLDYGPRAITTPWLNREYLSKLISQAEDQKKLAAGKPNNKSVVVAAHGHQDHANHS